MDGMPWKRDATSADSAIVVLWVFESFIYSLIYGISNYSNFAGFLQVRCLLLFPIYNKDMKYVSLFAGIGGFDLALNRAGHTCVYVNEWDIFAAKTYEKNFGHKPDTRDIKLVRNEEIPDHDLLCGGFPCQSFSIAGKRGGFSDTRGTMFFEIARIITDKRPPYLLLENVKGLLSHDNGRTFETIMRALDELGYECQWQVLNSKNFGVPQNRERVFIIGNLRGKPRPKIFPFTGEIGQTSATRNLAGTLQADYWKRDRTGSYVIKAQRIPLKFLTRNQRNITGDYAYTVDSTNTGGVVVGTLRTHKDGNGFREVKSGLSETIPARAREDGSGQPVIMENMRVRLLTPIECERLQGFPDNWTEGVSTTQRYKQLGNAVTVNVIENLIKSL